MADSTNKYVPIYAANRKKCDPTYVEEFVERIEDDIKAYIGIRMIMAMIQNHQFKITGLLIQPFKTPSLPLQWQETSS